MVGQHLLWFILIPLPACIKIHMGDIVIISLALLPYHTPSISFHIEPGTMYTIMIDRRSIPASRSTWFLVQITELLPSHKVFRE